MPGVSTNQLPLVVPGTSGVTVLSGVERVAADTEIANGASPQSVAAQTFQVAALAGAVSFAANQATVSAGSATLNTRTGMIDTGSLSTAAGATASFALVNSLATTGTPFSLGLLSKDNTTPGYAIQSAAINTSGTISVVVVNNGTAALNGHLLMPFLVGTQA